MYPASTLSVLLLALNGMFLMSPFQIPPHPFELRLDVQYPEAAQKSTRHSLLHSSTIHLDRSHRPSSFFLLNSQPPHAFVNGMLHYFLQPYSKTTTRRETTNRLFALSIYRAQPKLTPSNSKDGSAKTHKAQIVFSPSKNRTTKSGRGTMTPKITQILNTPE